MLHAISHPDASSDSEPTEASHPEIAQPPVPLLRWPGALSFCLEQNPAHPSRWVGEAECQWSGCCLRWWVHYATALSPALPGPGRGSVGLPGGPGSPTSPAGGGGDAAGRRSLRSRSQVAAWPPPQAAWWRSIDCGDYSEAHHALQIPGEAYGRSRCPGLVGAKAKAQIPRHRAPRPLRWGGLTRQYPLHHQQRPPAAWQKTRHPTAQQEPRCPVPGSPSAVRVLCDAARAGGSIAHAAPPARRPTCHEAPSYSSELIGAARQLSQERSASAAEARCRSAPRSGEVNVC